MSYTSASTFARSATLTQLTELIELLRYRRVNDGLRVKNRVGSYLWAETRDYKSHSGVELDIYRTPGGLLSVTTRSTVSRSYWDLKHQNQTLKLLRDLLGGHFVTDAGKSRYWRPGTKPPSAPTSGCYLARWHFHNAMVLAKFYLDSRKVEGNAAREEASGLEFLDRMNPLLLSNNMVLPYLVAIWEEYFKTTFIALLRYSTDREAVLKKARLSHEHLEQIATGAQSVEIALADTLSFQRPTSIATHFKNLDQRFDLKGTLCKPYRRRKITLFESLETLIETRHNFVHTGQSDTTLSTKQLRLLMSDLEVAVDRVYVQIHSLYGWRISREYR